MSATPTMTRRTVLEMKYGNTMSTRPQTNGTTAFCFLPYMKKPRPMEPKSSPQTKDAVLKASARVGRAPVRCHRENAVVPGLMVRRSNCGSLFDCPAGDCQAAQSAVYGERGITIQFLCRDLLWRPLRRVVR